MMAVLVIAGALLLVWFFRHTRALERRNEEPLLSTSLFHNRASNLGLVTQSVQWLILIGTAFVVSSLAAERLVKRHTQRRLILAGFVTTLCGIVLLLAMVYGSPSAWAFAPGLLFIGLGVGVMLTPSVNLVQSSFPDERQGEISGLSRSVSNLGSSLGTAVAGTILVAGLVERSYALAMITLAMVGMIGLVATVLLPDEPVPQGSTPT